MKRKSSLFLAGVVVAFLLLMLLIAPGQAAEPLLPPWDYTLGRGLTVGNTGLTIGGYASAQYEDVRDEPRRFSLSTVSTLISWDLLSRVRFLAELEGEDIYIAQQGDSPGPRDDPFEIERLYADFFVSDALALRVGKFLTPIGHWNERHAAPLVWTTSRPSVTSRPFPENTTGAMVHGTLTPFGHDLEYSAYTAFPDTLDPDEEESQIPNGTAESEEEVGLQLRSHLGSVQLGASYLNFRREEEMIIEGESGEEEIERESGDNLLGLDFLWSRNRYELSGEFIYRFSSKGSDNAEWGLFVQGVVPLPRQLYGIGRYEFYNPSGPIPGAHLWVMGMAFRPIPALILKAEYSVGHHNFADLPVGFAASVAILF